MSDAPTNMALVVEDDPAWKDILVEILSDMGMVVELAENLDISLGKITRSPHRLAVIDLSLGGSDHHNQDGFTVLDAVRIHDPGCVTILLTGYANVELAVSAISEHGALTCLRKETFNRRTFREILSRALARIPPAAILADGMSGSQRGNPIDGLDRIGAGVKSSPREMGEGLQSVLSSPPGLALVVEDSVAWRTLLGELLLEAGYQVHACSSYAEALGRLRREKYQLAVIDLSLAGSLPGVSVAWATVTNGQTLMDRDSEDGFRLLAGTRAGGIPTIVVSALDSPAEIERAYADHAIYTYMPKQVFTRRAFLDTVQDLIEKGETIGDEAAELSSLTAREREVLDLLAKGMTNREIADRMMISTNTVKRHLKAVFKKLDVHTRSAATARAVSGIHPNANDAEFVSNDS
jgi:DNA-binding NarL/FixJ family response regulator